MKKRSVESSIDDQAKGAGSVIKTEVSIAIKLTYLRGMGFRSFFAPKFRQMTGHAPERPDTVSEEGRYQGWCA